MEPVTQRGQPWLGVPWRALPLVFLLLALVWLGWAYQRASLMRTLFSHIDSGHVEAGLEMIRVHPFLAHQTLKLTTEGQWGGTGVTALQEAARRGSPELVEGLLEAGADPNHQDRHGYTPLHEAAGGQAPGRLAVIRLLLAAGADPGLRSQGGVPALSQAPESAGPVHPGSAYRRPWAPEEDDLLLTLALVVVLGGGPAWLKWHSSKFRSQARGRAHPDGPAGPPQLASAESLQVRERRFRTLGLLNLGLVVFLGLNLVAFRILPTPPDLAGGESGLAVLVLVAFVFLFFVTGPIWLSEGLADGNVAQANEATEARAEATSCAVQRPPDEPTR